LSVLWSVDLLKNLQQLSRESGVTVFMTLVAGLATLMYRYSGQSDLTLGSPIANRTHPQLEKLIGLFVNTLVLRVKVTGQMSFKTVIGTGSADGFVRLS